MANPRKFSEKIALHNKKQAEETAAFEAVLREVSATTQVQLTFKQVVVIDQTMLAFTPRLLVVKIACKLLLHQHTCRCICTSAKDCVKSYVRTYIHLFAQISIYEMLKDGRDVRCRKFFRNYLCTTVLNSQKNKSKKLQRIQCALKRRPFTCNVTVRVTLLGFELAPYLDEDEQAKRALYHSVNWQLDDCI